MRTTLRWVVVYVLCCFSSALADESRQKSIPETFMFVDPTYRNNRFLDSNALVVGGTSGIGFAGAVMIAQECAQGEWSS